jgi:tripartite-type tricarboxylate transporter receptor subunit TctC
MMKFPRRQFLQLAAGAAALPLMSGNASAQAYPSRPVRLVIGYTPGGSADLTARLMGQWLSEKLGQSFVIENRPGGGTNIATEQALRATPDGYTLLLVAPANAINATLYDKLPFDFIKEMEPIAGIIRFPNVVVVHPSLPIKSIPELIAYAKANPGKLNYGAAGPINLTNLAGELYKLKAGLDFVAVHFKSGAESITCVVGDQCQLTIDNVTAVRALMEDGKLRPLAVTSARRQSDFPDLPTMIEAGVPDYVVTSFFGVVAPAGTPAPVIARLNAVINEALRTEAVQAALKKLGAEPTIESPEEFTRFIAAEMRKWTEIAAIAGIKAD